MSIGTNVFVHNTATIKIKKSLANDTQSKDTWDIIIEDDKGERITVFCWGDNAILTADLTGENA
jgi:hypothetical protein